MSATGLESAVVFGLSAVLLEELLFKDGAPQASNFNDYPVRGMADIRQIHTKIVASDNPSTGIGEVGVPAASWASGIAESEFWCTRMTPTDGLLRQQFGRYRRKICRANAGIGAKVVPARPN